MTTPGPVEVTATKPAIGLRCEKPDTRELRIEKCGKSATECEVSGLSYSARAVLCRDHRELAEKRGFKVKVVA